MGVGVGDSKGEKLEVIEGQSLGPREWQSTSTVNLSAICWPCALMSSRSSAFRSRVVTGLMTVSPKSCKRKNDLVHEVHGDCRTSEWAMTIACNKRRTQAKASTSLAKSKYGKKSNPKKKKDRQVKSPQGS